MTRRNLPGISFVALCALAGFLTGARAADPVVLPTAGQGVHWGALAGAALFGAIVVGVIWYFRHNPGKVAAAKVAADRAGSEAEAIKSGLDLVVADLASVVRDLADHVRTRPAPASSSTGSESPQESQIPAPTLIAGKAGQAGLFSVQVSGDPAADWPMIIAAYGGAPKPAEPAA